MEQANIRALSIQDKELYLSFLSQAHNEMCLLPSKAESLADFYLSSGKTFGTFSKSGKLLMLIPAFDYNACRQSNSKTFNEVFNIDGKNIPYGDKLHVPLLCMPVSEIIYISGIIFCHDPSDIKENAKIIRHIAEINLHRPTAVCLQRPELPDLLKRSGFSLSSINKNYTLAIYGTVK